MFGRALGQNPDDGDDFFLFPINPSRVTTLAGTMGELRSTHFHNGIDIRTGGRSGIPVLSAADGFVIRVSVQTGGYGNALYIQHPNQTVTVYAHLQEFSSEISEYVLREQYRSQQFEINLFPKRDQFPVQRGDTVALSGNSGSSSGPHLHFDIRTTNQELLNPLKYNFEEIIDTKPPEVRRVALKTMNIDSRINNQFGRFQFAVEESEGRYYLRDTVEVHGEIGVELFAFDRQNNTRFRTGITSFVMKVDNEEVFREDISRIAFSEKRNFYVYTDFKSLIRNGSRYHKLYIEDGNTLRFYTSKKNQGKLKFNREGLHVISVIMKDTYENERELIIPVTNCNPSPRYNGNEYPYLEEHGCEIVDNTLVCHSTRSPNAIFYTSEGNYLLGPNYWINDSISAYLWDLRDGLPDSVNFSFSSRQFNKPTMILPGRAFDFYNEHADVKFWNRSLFDTTYFSIGYRRTHPENLEIFKIGEESTPLKRAIIAKLKPKRTYRLRDRAHVYSVQRNGSLGFVGGTWEGERISFRTSSFGDYTIETDTIQPIVEPLIVNGEELVFRIRDELSGIDNFRATVDGKWILMTYDYKKERITGVKPEENFSFSGLLELSVKDNAGNEKIYKTNIQ